jgi:hypothetical protein
VRDDRCSNICKSCTEGYIRQPDKDGTVEALVGTLKAAKKRKVVRYDSELLLQGVHDNVDIVLLQE